MRTTCVAQRTPPNACGDLNVKEVQEAWEHVWQGHSTLQQKLAQHFKATIHQKIKKEKNIVEENLDLLECCWWQCQMNIQ